MVTILFFKLIKDILNQKSIQNYTILKRLFIEILIQNAQIILYQKYLVMTLKQTEDCKNIQKKTKKVSKKQNEQKKIKINHFEVIKKGRPIKSQKASPQRNFDTESEKQNVDKLTQRQCVAIRKQIDDLINDKLMMKIFQAFIEFFYQFPNLTFSNVERKRMIKEKEQGCPITKQYSQFSDDFEKIKIESTFQDVNFKVEEMKQFVMGKICFYIGRTVDPQVTQQLYKLIKLIFTRIQKQKSNNNQEQQKFSSKNKNSAFKKINQRENSLDINSIRNIGQKISVEVTALVQKENRKAFPFFNYTFTRVKLSRKIVRHRLSFRHKKLFKKIVILILLKYYQLINLNQGKAFSFNEQILNLIEPQSEIDDNNYSMEEKEQIIPQRIQQENDQVQDSGFIYEQQKPQSQMAAQIFYSGQQPYNEEASSQKDLSDTKNKISEQGGCLGVQVK